MAFLDKLGFPGKKNKASQPFVNGKKRSLEEQILAARQKLEKAKMENMQVIEMELRNIRYDRRHKGESANVSRYFAKIKNAYYSMSVIEKTKLRLNDIETTQELFAALNDVTDAVKIINRIYQKTDKPKQGQFMRQSNKLDRNMENADAKIGGLYQDQKVESIDQLVSNEVVDRLLQGESVEACLRGEEGIKMPFEDLENMVNLADVAGSMEDVNTDGESMDMSDMDFNDF